MSLSVNKKKIFVIIGSASDNSANEKLVNAFIRLTEDNFDFTVFDGLRTLPHFDPRVSNDDPPELIRDFRYRIESSDAVLICTPEYIFSIPSGLKNALEWCVSTVVFSDKPVGLITASADGQTGHKELQLIMKTLMAKFTGTTTLLIQGIKSRIDEQGEIKDPTTMVALKEFTEAFIALVGNETVKQA